MTELQALRAEVAALRKKLGVLEGAIGAAFKILNTKVGAGLRYQGIYEAYRGYRAGDACTRSGSLWIATKNTAETPGQGSTAWQLGAKAGRNGRDLVHGKGHTGDST